MKTNDFIIPILLSDYVKTLEDWEIVEWLSRFAATSKYHKNGATWAEHDELMKEWTKRYPGEEVPIIHCVPPLDSELHMLSQYNASVFKNNSYEEETEDE